MKKASHLLTLFLLSSCAIFWNKNVENIDKGYKSKIHSLNLVFLSTYFGKHQTYVHNISEVYLDKKWKIPGGQSAIWQAEWYVDTIKDKILSTGYFETVKVDYARSKDSNQYSLEFNQIGNSDRSSLSPLQYLWAYGSLLTLGVIPYWGDRTVQLEVTLFKGERKIKSYNMTEEYHLYISIFLLPVTPFYFPVIQENKVSGYLAEQVIEKLKKDNLL